jgi:hypothetical protein
MTQGKEKNFSKERMLEVDNLLNSASQSENVFMSASFSPETILIITETPFNIIIDAVEE